MRWSASSSPTSRPESARRLLDAGVLALLRGLALPPLLRAPGPGPGVHGGTRRGREDALLQHRPYVRGDDRRSLDWRASARTGQLLIKERHAPARHPLVLLLDTSPSMDFPERGEAKSFRARQLAAAAAVLALWRGDLVHLHRWAAGGFGHRLELRPGRAVIARVEAALAEQPSGGPGTLAVALSALPSEAVSSGRIVLLSDLYGDAPGLASALGRLARLASGLSVLQVLASEERSPAPGLWRDLETGEVRSVGTVEAREATERVARWRSALRGSLAALGATFVDVDPGDPVAQTLGRWLGAKG
jgi:uncharacterized protein (DUF58 family)